MIELNNFQTQKGLSCHMACAKNILAFYEADISECLLYAIGKGFRYIYNRDPKWHNNKYRIHTDVPLTLNNFFDRFQIEYTLIENMENEIAEEYLIKSLQNNEPLMIGVINNDLTYDLDYASHSKDWAHIVVATGLDLDQQKIKISDGFIPSNPPRLYAGWYSYKIIKETREKRNNWCYKIGYESVKKFKKQFDNEMLIEEHLVPNLKECILEMLDGKIVEDNYYGIEALKKYHEVLMNFTDYFAGDFDKELLQQNIDMKVEGFIDNKKYLFQVVNELSIIKHSNDLMEISEKLEVNLEEWIKFCLLMVKVALSEDRKKVVLLAKRFEEIYKEEIALYNTLLNYL